MSNGKYIFHGTIIDTPDPSTLRIRKQHICTVNKGKIEIIEPADSLNTVDLYRDYTIIHLSESQFICPGFVDLHCHAPQYRQVGSATEVPLLQWLDKFTFPNEARCADLSYARNLYTKLVSRLLRNGTTTVQYFATIHLEATKTLADICQEKGQRAYIGKVCADRNSPDFYIETTEESVRYTEEFINYVHRMEKGRDIAEMKALIHPVVTPRFVPTCSLDLLAQLGQLANKYDVHIQSHIAETADQVAFVHALHPDIGNGRDVAIFNQTGLLTNKAVFAHGVYLADDEVDHMIASGSAVASCPIANFLFSKGITAIERFRRKGLKVGLGTDVGGGYSSNMLPVVRAAVFGNRTMDFVSIDRSIAALPEFPEHKDPDIDFTFAFYLATLGGAHALNIDTHIGSFEIGKEFDALLVDCNKDDQAFDYWSEDESDIIFEKWVLPEFPEHKDPDIDFTFAFYLATLGGAHALNIDTHIGSFEIGKEFDALLVDCNKDDQAFDYWSEDESDIIFEKWVNAGDDRNIVGVWVQGRKVC
ncbi:unnamed protein product [Adineta ricciae]|uniref:Guanine deaminase n=1 Tax=Adineta ricciae TaxID=249248 RepID=A0A814V1L6_ADIRI|nr:unnamed protein product [Adineta ricciae]